MTEQSRQKNSDHDEDIQDWKERYSEDDQQAPVSRRAHKKGKQVASQTSKKNEVRTGSPPAKDTASKR